MSVTHHQRAVLRGRLRPHGRRSRRAARSPSTSLSAATSTRSCRWRSSAWSSTAGTSSRCSRRLGTAWTPSTSSVSRCTPTTRASAGCHHVYIEAPGSDARQVPARDGHPPGWFDRSPCGTGTWRGWPSCTLAGELPLHTDFVNESFIGTHSSAAWCRPPPSADVPAVIPTISGRAWITGTAQYFLADDDPFPAGFLL